MHVQVFPKMTTVELLVAKVKKVSTMVSRFSKVCVPCFASLAQLLPNSPKLAPRMLHGINVNMWINNSMWVNTNEIESEQKTSIKKGFLVSSRTYNLSNEDILGLSEGTVKWCELLASYNRQTRQINCEARYLFNDSYVFPWDRNSVNEEGPKKKREIHLVIENSDKGVIPNDIYKQGKKNPKVIGPYEGLFNSIKTLMGKGYEDDKNRIHEMMLVEDNIEWCVHVLGKTVQSSNNGELSSLNGIQGFLDETLTKAADNVGKCTQTCADIPALSKPIPEKNNRTIFLIARTESLMEDVWKLNGQDSTRVHVFYFGKKAGDLKNSKDRLKQKYGTFPNYYDYGELETNEFPRKLLR